MKRLLRPPSPAVLLATVAVFLAAGGTAYALSITGADVVNGSLTGSDIRNRSLTQSDLHGRSLKGTLMQQDSVGNNAVKEEVLDASKLGKVSSAESADSVAGVAVRRFAASDLDLGASKGLGTIGPFSLIARCRVDGTDHVAEILIQTNQNGSAVDGAVPDASLDIGETATLVRAQAAANTPAFAQGASGVAISPDGTEILGQQLYAGTSVLGHAGTCRFGGLVTVG